ncbi:MAG TPA: hypothetical protein VF255_01640 [Solirubrobacterales bacterium]
MRRGLIGAALAASLVSLALAAPSVVADTADPHRPLGTSVVLGGVVYGGDYGEGWGVERPDTIYNGGVPSGLISKVHWSSWGGAVARGRGRHPIYKPRGGYYRHPVVAQLKAIRIGTCEGRDAYLKLLIREPRRPGGPLGPWYSWSGPQTICEPYGSYLGPSRRFLGSLAF